jgi:small subunit ribosomal protein S6e
MKFNISNPTTGQNLPLVVDQDKILLHFYGKKMGQEVDASVLGDQWKGYILKITGGNDKDGFTMKQGILIQGRTRLLMSEGHSTYRPRRSGERKKKSVRGCIVGPDISALALTVVKQGESQIEGLNNEKKPRRRGPKRATRIRKLFNLDKKKDDVRRFVVLYKRTIEKNGKKRVKCPKIQRLVTPDRLRRKRIFKTERVEAWKNTTKAKGEYRKLLQDLRKKRLAAATKSGAEKAALKRGENPADKKPVATKKVDPKAAATKKDDKKGGDKKGAAATTATKGKEQTKTQAPATKTTAPVQTKPADTKKTAKK